MNRFLKGAAVFIGGVIVVIDMVSWKDLSLLHSSYRFPDPTTDNAPPRPREGNVCQDYVGHGPSDSPPEELSSSVNFQDARSEPADKVSVSGSVEVPRETFGAWSQRFIV